jgi:hypothetical protein
MAVSYKSGDRFRPSVAIMRLSVSITPFPWWGAELAHELTRIARRAEDGGPDPPWVPNHLIQGLEGREPTDPMLKGWTTVNYLAVTSRIRPGRHRGRERDYGSWAASVSRSRSQDVERCG